MTRAHCLLAFACCFVAGSVRADDWVTYPAQNGPGNGKHLVFLTGDEEYRSEEGLPMLAKILSQRHGFKCTVLFSLDADATINPDKSASLAGAEMLDSADGIVMQLRFRAWPDEAMKHFVQAYHRGVPIMGLRTSTHAFRYPAKSTSAYTSYNDFGKDVLGEGWVSHWGANRKGATRGIIEPSAKDDPILQGVTDIFGDSGVYEVHPAADAKILVRGQVLQGMKPSDPPADYKKKRSSDKMEQGVNDPMMAVAWTRVHKNDAGKENKVFCTTLGAATDLESEGLRRLVVNAVYWGFGLDVPAKADVAYVGDFQPTPYGFKGFKKNVKPADLALKQAPAGKEPPTDWIDPATGHRVIRLSGEGGESSLYFHQNTYTPEGDKLIFNSKAGIAVVDLKDLGVKSPKVELVVKGASAIAMARKSREVYFTRGKGGPVYAANVDTLAVRELKHAKGGTINADETIAVTTVSATDPSGNTPRPEPRKLLPQRQRMFGDKLLMNIPLTPEEEASAAKEQKLASRLANPTSQALVLTDLKTGEARTVGYQYAWLNHLQFSPTDPNLLMYCHEGTWHEVDRVWTIRTDGAAQRLMHKRTMDMEIAGHEFWSYDGKMVWFDLQTPRSNTFWLAGVNIDSGAKVRYKIERNQWSIHYNVSRDGKLFGGDGGDPGQVAFAKDGRWIYTFTPEPAGPAAKDGWSEGTFQAEKLVDMARHNYKLEPNVTITPDGRWVVFRSNMHGPTHVYAAEVKRSK